MKSVVFTDAMLENGKSEAGGWNRNQLRLLGVSWPLARGWKKKVVGRPYSASTCEAFLSLRGRTKSVIKSERIQGEMDDEFHSILE